MNVELRDRLVVLSFRLAGPFSDSRARDRALAAALGLKPSTIRQYRHSTAPRIGRRTLRRIILLEQIHGTHPGEKEVTRD